MYVVDASVVLKWFVDEEDSGAACELRDRFLDGQIELAAPDLLVYEIAHVLLRKKGLGPAEIRDALSMISRVDLTVSPLDIDQMTLAVDLASSTGTSVYDATYLALAVRLRWSLVTADQKFASAVGPRLPVLLLGAIA